MWCRWRRRSSTVATRTELNRRYPDRAKMRPADADGFREAWDILNEEWEHRLYAERDFDVLESRGA